MILNLRILERNIPENTGRHKLYADLLQEYNKDDFKPQLVRKTKKSDWFDYQHIIPYIKLY